MIVIKKGKLVDIDLVEGKGVLLIEQEVLLEKRDRLDPILLNKDLANRIAKDKKVINELKNYIKNMLVEKFGTGSLGLFDREPTIDIYGLRYMTDRRNMLNLYVYFKFKG